MGAYGESGFGYGGAKGSDYIYSDDSTGLAYGSEPVGSENAFFGGFLDKFKTHGSGGEDHSHSETDIQFDSNFA